MNIRLVYLTEFINENSEEDRIVKTNANQQKEKLLKGNQP